MKLPAVGPASMISVSTSSWCFTYSRPSMAPLLCPSMWIFVDTEVRLEILDLLRELGAVVRDAASWRDVGQFEADIARLEAIVPCVPGFIDLLVVASP